MTPEVLLTSRYSVPTYVTQTWRVLMKSRDPKLTYEEVAARLAYDPDSGVITWKDTRNNKMKPGDVAGHVGAEGYRRITLGGDRKKLKRVMAHRLAWLLAHGEWPVGFIDHIDGDRLNNRLSNLRLATKAENRINTGPNAGKEVPFKGVRFDKNPRRRKRYVAVIKIDGKQRTLGYFATPEEAKAAYDAVARALHGKFYRS